MKIGILTFWWTQDNYGQLLQAYALQSYLRNLGYNAFLIRYNCTKDDVVITAKRKDVYIYIKKALNPIKVINFLKNKIESKFKIYQMESDNRIHPRHFDEFRRNFISMSDKIYYSVTELKEYPPEADVYIVGSDQVWNYPDVKKAVNKISAYFLDFGAFHTKRISYAASFSRPEFPDEYYKIIAPLLAKFSTITVREDDAIDICLKAGRNDAVVVPDPTLLIDRNNWLNLSSNKNDGKHYCLLYLVGNKTDISMREIYRYAKQKGLEIKYVAIQKRYDCYDKVYPTVNAWLGLVADAEIIITNSFHGTVFAILFNKPFIVFPQTGSVYELMNNRIHSLLAKYRLEDRICYSSKLDVLINNINWEAINESLQRERERAKKILSVALSK